MRTKEQVQADPWGHWDDHFGDMGSTCDVQDRCSRIKCCQLADREWLRNVLRDPNLQLTVRKAAERKYKQLLKQAIIEQELRHEHRG